MKQIWPTYAYSPTTNVLTLTGLNIDRDQLLLVTAADRGRIMYNFADSSVTASAFTSGANTALTLVATTAGLTTTAALVIYFDDQATSSTVTGTVELGPTSLNALESITVTMGQVTVTGGLTDVQLRASAVTVGGTVTVGNSLTIGSLPAISGTVTANLGNVAGMPLDNPPSHAVRIGWADEDTLRSAGLDNGGEPLPIQIYLGNSSADNVTTANPLPISALPAGTNRIGVVTIGAGTVTLGAGTAQIGSVTASISGTVPISISSVTVGNSVTIGSLPALVEGSAQIGTVTVSNISSLLDAGENPVIRTFMFGYDYDNETPIAIASDGNALKISGTVTVGNSVTIDSLPAISGTVTANSSNGSLTTRFGSVATANTAFATSAVTNSNRKYLLIQNITTASNVITVGIGFTPTTTQGIQLFAGAGLTFEGNYIPTGAVNLLSSATASCYTILEA
jgi:hypothetical protein